jgi:hypothetical protein
MEAAAVTAAGVTEAGGSGGCSARLSDDETRLLDAASDPGAADYPYGERGRSQRDRRISAGRF